MTLHVHYSHECTICAAYYIPYEEVPCPRCGLVEERRFDFIPRAVDSMRANRERTGAYTPPAWWTGSLADHLLYLLFGLFDVYERAGEGGGVGPVAVAHLDRVEWGDQAYLRSHLEGIALRVKEELDRLPPPATTSPVRPFQDAPPVEVTPYIPGWVRCPGCGKRFALASAGSWSGGRHVTCGQKMALRAPH